MASRAKRLEFAIELGAEGRMLAGGEPLEPPTGWTAEHLLLAALARCSLTSLRYHARRASLTVRATASAEGVVARRPSDERYAFVELEVRIDMRLDPDPGGEASRDLVAKAERDCFIGASLTAVPAYSWCVGGRAIGRG